VRRIQEERGASAVEFAIIASLLLMILFGTITFGIVFNRYQGLQSAAREGARIGSLFASTRTEVINRVKESASIIATTAFDDAACDPTALDVDEGCVRIYAKQKPTATCPGAQCVEVNSASPAQAPCGASYSGTDKSVVVDVFYRTRIDIPFWASPEMTINGGAEFKCE
jgi:Flp pilus assembly pilin Flp